MPPVTNPHGSGYTWTCEACDPPETINASSQREIDKAIADHNAEFHPA